MKFQIRNLGPVREAELELGDLTILCGKNNTGKTYVTYSVYGLLHHIMWTSVDFGLDNSISEELYETGKTQIDLTVIEKKIPQLIENYFKVYSENLHQMFSCNKDNFENCELKLILDDYKFDYDRTVNYSHEHLRVYKAKDSRILEISLLPPRGTLTAIQMGRLLSVGDLLSYLLLKKYPLRTLIFTSERLGISLFYKELDESRSRFLDRAMKLKNQENIASIFDTISRYAKPIKENIDFTRNLDITEKQESFLIKEKPDLASYLENMTDGCYKLRNGKPIFMPGEEKTELPIHMGSTSVRSLMDLNFYVKHLAQKNDLVMIDEPELNLHPENQIRLARFFAKLVNSGIRIFITTHSDYIIKELNNLIMLSNNFGERDALMREHGYENDEVLKPSQLRVYVAENNTLTPATVDEMGIEASSFEETIDKLNHISDEILFALED